MKNFALIPGLLLLSACSFAPDYHRPELPVPTAWDAISPSVQQAEGAVWGDMGWTAFFPDKGLQGLIQTALQHNRDLRVAVLNIDAARAAYRVTEADLLPRVDAGLSESAQRIPQALSQSISKQARVSHQYNANLAVTAFELDLFGRLRSLNQQALETYLATEAARDATRIALIAEVANAYVTLLGDRTQLSLAESTLDTRLRTLELIERRLDVGMSNALDRAQARTAVESARASLARYTRLVEQDRNALQLLVGAPVVGGTLPATLDGMVLVEDLPVGLPSEVLLRRPDVMQAEHALKAANANIGAARAAFFPRISLTAMFGLASPALSNLFEVDSRVWSFAPGVTFPIFDAGRNEATLAASKANRDIAVARYEKAIQSAFREVSDGLAARRTLVDQAEAQKALADAAATSLRLSDARYRQGIDNYLAVLDAQRTLYDAQQSLIQVQVQRLSNLVSLYKALGGGRA